MCIYILKKKKVVKEGGGQSSLKDQESLNLLLGTDRALKE